MGNIKAEIFKFKKHQRKINKKLLKLPAYFNFKNHDAFDFDTALKVFDWDIRNCQVQIDFTECKSANYQTLALIVLYSWRLKSNNCTVDYLLDDHENGASSIWKMMGAPGLFSVAFNETQNFNSNKFKPIIALRNHQDFKLAIEKSEEFSTGFDIEYINTLRYVISELLYNALEHGVCYFENHHTFTNRIPSLIQFTWYAQRNEIQFIVGDVGIGIKSHLSQTYPGIEDDDEALRFAIRPQVSGTFGKSDPYTSKNNAGMGLFISSNIIRRLNADMHIVSGSSVLHISPRDITTRKLYHVWNGTFALVTIRLDTNSLINLHALMSEFREAAERENAVKSFTENEEKFYIHIQNIFGIYPEDKSAAISYRDKYILSALEAQKKIVIDFNGVLSSPHSFLNALLATPIKRLGLRAYKNIKIINAVAEIRETIDFILDDNTSDNTLNFDSD